MLSHEQSVVCYIDMMLSIAYPRVQTADLTRRLRRFDVGFCDCLVQLNAIIQVGDCSCDNISLRPSSLLPSFSLFFFLFLSFSSFFFSFSFFSLLGRTSVPSPVLATINGFFLQWFEHAAGLMLTDCRC